MPDLRSPGPGSTDAEVGNMADAPADEVSAVALIKPDYIVGGPGTGTTSPNTITVPLRKMSELGVIVPLGTSGNDE